MTICEHTTMTDDELANRLAAEIGETRKAALMDKGARVSEFKPMELIDGAFVAAFYARVPKASADGVICLIHLAGDEPIEYPFVFGSRQSGLWCGDQIRVAVYPRNPMLCDVDEPLLTEQ